MKKDVAFICVHPKGEKGMRYVNLCCVIAVKPAPNNGSQLIFVDSSGLYVTESPLEILAPHKDDIL